MLLKQYVSRYIIIVPGPILVENYIHCLSFDENTLSDKSLRKRNLESNKQHFFPIKTNESMNA